MKQVFVLFCSVVLALHLQAQGTISTFGEYYLQGEMEMAGGFKLDSNGRFQFFYSYGALDRQASGTWQKEGDRLVLNSEPKGIQDFQLTVSKMNPGKQVTILITDAPSHIFPYITAMIKLKGKEFSAQANKQGQIVFPVGQADSIVLQFQWCPEKISRYAVGRQNYFTFRMLPSVTDVIFDRNVFTITAQEIYGPLPFSGDHVCHFRREDNSSQSH